LFEVFLFQVSGWNAGDFYRKARKVFLITIELSKRKGRKAW